MSKGKFSVVGQLAKKFNPGPAEYPAFANSVDPYKKPTNLDLHLIGRKLEMSVVS